MLKKLDADFQMDKFKKDHGIMEDLNFDLKNITRETICRGVVAFLEQEADF